MALGAGAALPVDGGGGAPDDGLTVLAFGGFEQQSSARVTRLRIRRATERVSTA